MPFPQVKIRRARIIDTARICAIRHSALDSTAGHFLTIDQVSALKRICNLKYIERALSKQDHEIFLAETNQVAIGFSWLMTGANRAHLWSLYVEPNSVGRGFGTRLLQVGEQQALARGYGAVFVSALPDAVPFYSHNGYLCNFPFNVELESPENEPPIQVPAMKMSRSLGSFDF